MARRSAAEAAETRVKILVEARRLFAENGYVATSAREIAVAAGVTVGALFHHFGSKAGLFHAVFEQLVGELNDAAMEEFRDCASDNPLDAIMLSTKVALSFAEKADFHQIVTVDGPVVLGADQWREIDSRMGLRTVSGGVKSLQNKGMMVDLPTMPLAVLIMGAMNNAGFALARKEAGVNVDNLVVALRRLIEGLAPRDGPDK